MFIGKLKKNYIDLDVLLGIENNDTILVVDENKEPYKIYINMKDNSYYAENSLGEVTLKRNLNNNEYVAENKDGKFTKLVVDREIDPLFYLQDRFITVQVPTSLVYLLVLNGANKCNIEMLEKLTLSTTAHVCGYTQNELDNSMNFRYKLSNMAKDFLCAEILNLNKNEVEDFIDKSNLQTTLQE
ncbi:MAG: hypothetical protein IJZ29_03505 [Clostridia bacterium]|nr:hypothetical protein [Clostridia bacterium]